MTTVFEIINTLSDLGVVIRVQDDNLVVTPKSKVPAELVEELRQCKGDLVTLLTGLCFCQPPMPRADVESQPCQRCGLAGWCAECGGCRWCAFQLRWDDHLLPKYRRRRW
jgi:hypothetical protein